MDHFDRVCAFISHVDSYHLLHSRSVNDLFVFLRMRFVISQVSTVIVVYFTNSFKNRDYSDEDYLFGGGEFKKRGINGPYTSQSELDKSNNNPPSTRHIEISEPYKCPNELVIGGDNVNKSVRFKDDRYSMPSQFQDQQQQQTPANLRNLKEAFSNFSTNTGSYGKRANNNYTNSNNNINNRNLSSIVSVSSISPSKGLPSINVSNENEPNNKSTALTITSEQQVISTMQSSAHAQPPPPTIESFESLYSQVQAITGGNVKHSMRINSLRQQQHLPSIRDVVNMAAMNDDDDDDNEDVQVTNTAGHDDADPVYMNTSFKDDQTSNTNGNSSTAYHQSRYI